MRTTKSRCLARAGLLALLGALTLLALPSTSLAADVSRTDDSPELLARGAGYANPATARDVRVLQQRLRALGWRPGPIDGLFGPRTEQAVVGFQHAAGLVADGIAGPRTKSALDRASQKPLARGAGYRPPAGSPRVRMLQQRLRRAGFNPGQVDGVFGPRTQAAVERLQRAGGLSANGIVGRRTRRLLAERSSDSRPARRPAAPGARSDRSRTARGPAPERSRDSGTRAGRRSGVPTARAMRSTSEAIDGLGEDGDSSSGPLLLLAAAALGLLAVSALMLVRLFATSGGVTVGLPQRMPFRAPAQPHPSGVTEESGAKAQPSGVTEGSGAQPHPSGVTEGSGAKAQPSEGTDGSDATARPQPSVAAKGPVAPAQMQASRPPVAPAPAHPQQSVVRNGSVPTLGTAVASAHRGREARKEPLMDGVRALGYVSVFENESFHDAHVKSQMEEIDSLCERRGWRLVELVRDKEAPSGKALDRPGLGYALERMQAGEASCLIVSKLRRLSHSVADIGRILDVIRRAGGRLVALDLGIDTATPEGRKAANVLLAVSDWERQRLAERTRQGLEATRAKGGAVGRPSVHDVPELKQRIVELRESGLTLQAIADRLNAEGVPTLRGGQMWRPSAVQAAAGYRRPARGTGRFETEESRNARSAE